MDLMVNPVITGFRQDVDGTIKELKLGEAKQDAWANIAEQGASAKLENNKTATIDVSTYTDPVEVKPSSGKDGMKKATITLSNIPSPSGANYQSVAQFETSRGYEDCLVFFETTTYPEVNTTVNVLVVKPDFEYSETKIITGSDYILHNGPALFTTDDAGCGETCYWVEWENEPGVVAQNAVSSSYKWTPEP